MSNCEGVIDQGVLKDDTSSGVTLPVSDAFRDDLRLPYTYGIDQKQSPEQSCALACAMMVSSLRHCFCWCCSKALPFLGGTTIRPTQTAEHFQLLMY